MKSVKFNLNKNEIFTTYSDDEYDRLPIDSVMYMKCYNKISDYDWLNIFKNLNFYKMCEMIVHKSSLRNTKIH